MNREAMDLSLVLGKIDSGASSESNKYKRLER